MTEIEKSVFSGQILGIGTRKFEKKGHRQRLQQQNLLREDSVDKAKSTVPKNSRETERKKLKRQKWQREKEKPEMTKPQESLKVVLRSNAFNIHEYTYRNYVSI